MISQFHPTRILDTRLGKRIPPRMRAALQTLIVILAWYGLLSSFFSILSSLSWVVDLADWIWLNAGHLKPLLTKMAAAIHSIVQLWRDITAPLYRALFSWLPFQVPRAVLDVLIIASIAGGGYLRAWLATRRERKLMAMFNRGITPEGRYAVVKRIMLANEILSDDDAPLAAKDKAEGELVSALNEMTEGISDSDFATIEAAFDLTPDELRTFLLKGVVADQEARAIRKKILSRSTTISIVLAVALVVDVIYRAASA
jgi:hypothetical protein